MEEVKHKAKLICSGILEYYVHHDANNINLNVDFGEDSFVITASGSISISISSSDLFELNRLIGSQRCDDVAIYYSELLDFSADDYSIFHLLGMLVDSGSIEYENNILSFNLKRFYHSC